MDLRDAESIYKRLDLIQIDPVVTLEKLPAFVGAALSHHHLAISEHILCKSHISNIHRLYGVKQTFANVKIAFTGF